jgi:hypothetical protein
MSSNITLSAGVRQNLMSLQSTAELMSLTQNRLATGKKVNSALDNPANFFTSVSLQSRAKDLSNLLDSMSNGIKVLEAADNGIKAITKTVESMQSIIRQARQDKSQTITPGSLTATGGNTSTATNSKMTFDLGSGVTVSIDTYTQTVNATATTLTSSGFQDITAGTAGNLTITSADVNGGAAVDVALADGDDIDAVVAAINSALDAVAGGTNIRASNVGGEVRLTSSTGQSITVGDDGNGTAAQVGFGTGNNTSSNGSPEVPGSAKSLSDLVTAINTNSALSGKVKASIDSNGDLKLEPHHLGDHGDGP